MRDKHPGQDSPPRTGDTHFGYDRVEHHEKASRVGQVFDSVAERYDLMNDLMSLGLHRLWKKIAIAYCATRPGERVLDLAAGTGDLTRPLRQLVGDQGLVVHSDINRRMLGLGRDRLLDQGVVRGVATVQLDAQAIPLRESSVDLVTMAFGLRNVTDQDQALREVWRVLKPGGRLVILEFSRLRVPPLRPLYDWYSFAILPALGRLVAGDARSYRYLAESIRMHPDQNTLRAMMERAGFVNCDYQNLSAGIVALHRGFKALGEESD